jgi:Ca2+/Na+ antiporter
LTTNIVSADATITDGKDLGIALVIGGAICIIGVIVGLLTVYFAD